MGSGYLWRTLSPADNTWFRPRSQEEAESGPIAIICVISGRERLRDSAQVASMEAQARAEMATVGMWTVGMPNS
jgi:hypothetical protein